jgi:hypothetical protein
MCRRIILGETLTLSQFNRLQIDIFGILHGVNRISGHAIVKLIVEVAQEEEHVFRSSGVKDNHLGSKVRALTCDDND